MKIPSPGDGVSIVGQRMRRPDAPDKVKGTALYVDDLAVAGALYGGVLRSPHAHARIVAPRRLAPARALPGVHAVLTAARHPRPEPHPHDPGRLAGAGAASSCATWASRWPWWRPRRPEALQRALHAIAVEYEPRAPLLDMEEALRAGEVLAHWKVRRGRGRGRAQPRRPRGGGGDLPHALPGARLHRAQRHDRHARRHGRRHRAWARCSARSTCRRRWPPPSAST